jgi:hypothetical protein
VSAVIVLRFALAIVCNALAFVVWDVGTRPPRDLVRDVARGARVPAVLARGLLRFVVGCALLCAGLAVARPAIPTLRAFTFIETGMLIAALLVETLVGPDLRRRLRTPA